jgi:hypothetical protein
MSNAICPYCEQDYVKNSEIHLSSGEILLCKICFECDTLWSKHEKVTPNTGINYELFMEKKGENPNWQKVHCLE